MTSLCSEDHILAIINEYFPNSGSGLLVGRGDDCALMELDRETRRLVVTSDVFVDNVHFRRRYFSPEAIGHKALAVNLSDLASSGARPQGFTLCLTLAGWEDEHWLRGFCSSMAALAAQQQCLLLGGDLAHGTVLNITITALGTVPDSSMPLLRRGVAREGDILFICGELGLARTGLSVLEGSRNSAEAHLLQAQWPCSCQQHLRPLPWVEAGLKLQAIARHYAGSGGERLGLMDVSDGLARDIPRLLGETPFPGAVLGAELLLPPERLHPEVREYTRLSKEDPACFAYKGGEDYCLLGSCPPSLWPHIQAALPQAWYLGRVCPGAIVLNGLPWDQPGFDHFAK